MKLIKFFNKKYNTKFSNDYLFCLGFNIEDKKKRGIYFLFTLPFKKYVDIIDSETFKNKNCLCRKKYYFMIRKDSLNKIRFYFVKKWVSVESKNVEKEYLK